MHFTEYDTRVAAYAVIIDAGRILLSWFNGNHRNDPGWTLPGGGVDYGEQMPAAVRREVKEETGYDVEVETITGTYTNPNHRMAYDDGEVRQQFSIAFRARLLGGTPRTSSESSEVEWLTPEQIEQLEVHPSMRLRLQHALSDSGRPFIG